MLVDGERQHRWTVIKLFEPLTLALFRLQSTFLVFCTVNIASGINRRVSKVRIRNATKSAKEDNHSYGIVIDRIEITRNSQRSAVAIKRKDTADDRVESSHQRQLTTVSKRRRSGGFPFASFRLP